MEQPEIINNKINLIRVLKEKFDNNINFRDTLNEILKNVTIQSSIDADIFVFILYILGDYERVMSLKAKIKDAKILNNQDEFNHLFSIATEFVKDPFCDIYSHIYFFFTINSQEINILAQVYLNIYEREQAVYLSKLYSKMKFTTLKNYLGIFQKNLIN